MSGGSSLSRKYARRQPLLKAFRLFLSGVSPFKASCRPVQVVGIVQES